LLEHVNRQYTVLKLKIENENPRSAERAKNFHKRLCELENDVRQLKRGR